MLVVRVVDCQGPPTDKLPTPIAAPKTEPTAGVAVAPTMVPTVAPLPPPRPSTPRPTRGEPPPPVPTPAPTMSYYQMATKNVYVSPPKKLSSGGTRGNIPLGYTNASSKRNGVYYLPRGYQNKRLPVMVMLHGSGSSGSQVFFYYKSLADKYKFIFIGPDSHYSLNWLAPADKTRPFTEDYMHVLACYEYVRKLKNVLFDYNRIVMGGNSRGGYQAMNIASRTDWATHIQITHSSVTAGTAGPRVAPVWISTGEKDPLFGPGTTKNNIARFIAAMPGFKNSFTFEVFRGGHALNQVAELEASIKWWYSTAGARSSKTYLKLLV